MINKISIKRNCHFRIDFIIRKTKLLIYLENDIIEKSSGGVYKFKGKTLARGEEKFQKLLEEDDELRRKLLKKAEINTIGTTRKKIVALTTNLYPVDGVEYESFNESDDEEEDDE